MKLITLKLKTTYKINFINKTIFFLLYTFLFMKLFEKHKLLECCFNLKLLFILVLYFLYSLIYYITKNLREN